MQRTKGQREFFSSIFGYFSAMEKEQRKKRRQKTNSEPNTQKT